MNLKMKNLARDMVTKDDAVERCHDWLSHEMRRLWKASYERDANSEIYERVGREMLGEIGDLVYGADAFDKLFGIVKLEEAI